MTIFKFQKNIYITTLTGLRFTRNFELLPLHLSICAFQSSAASAAVTAAAVNGAVAEIEDVAEDADVVTDEHDEADDDKAVATKEVAPLVSSCVTSASRCKSFSLMRAKRCCCCCRH
uniref:Uncharacterized protein n=1 Tax=Glossina pallidipes TaxID=7398 RepID=A0A1A9ZTA9_GLOPL